MSVFYWAGNRVSAVFVPKFSRHFLSLSLCSIPPSQERHCNICWTRGIANYLQNPLILLHVPKIRGRGFVFKRSDVCVSVLLFNFANKVFFSFLLFQNEDKMTEGLQYSHLIYLSCSRSLLFLNHIGFIFFCWHSISQKTMLSMECTSLPYSVLFFIVPLLQPCYQNWFFVGK